jgi:hypothetical protein
MHKPMDKEIEEEIKLSAEDLETLAYIISESSTAPTIAKLRGSWRQSYFMDDIIEGFQIVDPEVELLKTREK